MTTEYKTLRSSIRSVLEKKSSDTEKKQKIKLSGDKTPLEQQPTLDEAKKSESSETIHVRHGALRHIKARRDVDDLIATATDHGLHVTRHPVVRNKLHIISPITVKGDTKRITDFKRSINFHK